MATFRPANPRYLALAFGFALVTSALSGLSPVEGGQRTTADVVRK